jgi:hypothetical protein
MGGKTKLFITMQADDTGRETRLFHIMWASVAGRLVSGGTQTVNLRNIYLKSISKYLNMNTIFGHYDPDFKFPKGQYFQS